MKKTIGLILLYLLAFVLIVVPLPSRLSKREKGICDIYPRTTTSYPKTTTKRGVKSHDKLQ